MADETRHPNAEIIPRTSTVQRQWCGTVTCSENLPVKTILSLIEWSCGFEPSIPKIRRGTTNNSLKKIRRR